MLIEVKCKLGFCDICGSYLYVFVVVSGEVKCWFLSLLLMKCWNVICDEIEKRIIVMLGRILR